MSNYDELYKQHQELTKKLEDAKKEEANKAIKTIRELISKFDLEPEDYAVNPHIKKTLKKKKEFQYKDPASGNGWTGHGRTPGWIKDKSEEEREAMRVKPDGD
ncbi:H-NS histone family protein [Glaciimonas sp. PCH181]|uniref:H-NS histone family protein n=1 Tax=Glaciimonas sp. PCH181 TaxID=2133943 RepID=UPI001374A74E|nr:H-NS histone family protein [Glaciimonas sp. PCH181]